MLYRDIIHTNAVSKRIFDIIQDVYDFVLVLGSIVFELLQCALAKCLPSHLKDISNEIVLITGAGHGIGRELALHYAAWGCAVVCVDINEKGNAETLRKVSRITKKTVASYVCDVSNHKAVQELADRVLNDMGPVTVLVNNVGIMPTHPLQKHTAVEIQRSFDINVLSQFWTVQSFLPHMKQASHGHIIAISSIAGVVGLANLVPYCATKFAVRGMMEALHEELREGAYRNLIRTTTIYPYMTNTGLCKRPKVKFPSILGLLDPKEVAKSIVRAHRMNVLEATIPQSLLHINNWCRLLPAECGLQMKDYIDSGVESDL